MGRCCKLIFGNNKNNPRLGNPITKEVHPTIGGEQKNEETNRRVLKGNKRLTCLG